MRQNAIWATCGVRGGLTKPGPMDYARLVRGSVDDFVCSRGGSGGLMGLLHHESHLAQEFLFRHQFFRFVANRRAGYVNASGKVVIPGRKTPDRDLKLALKRMT